MKKKKNKKQKTRTLNPKWKIVCYHEFGLKIDKGLEHVSLKTRNVETFWRNCDIINPINSAYIHDQIIAEIPFIVRAIFGAIFSGSSLIVFLPTILSKHLNRDWKEGLSLLFMSYTALFLVNKINIQPVQQNQIYILLPPYAAHVVPRNPF